MVDFDSPAAIAVTEKWVGMYTKDKSAQPTAVNDGYPQLYALMEKGKCGDVDLRPACAPALITALGDAIQAVPTPNVGSKPYMLANPGGPLMLTTCKEKEAAWEFIEVHLLGRAGPLFTQKRGCRRCASRSRPSRPIRTTASSRSRSTNADELVDAAVLAQELGELPGQDRARTGSRRCARRSRSSSSTSRARSSCAARPDRTASHGASAKHRGGPLAAPLLD